MRLTVRLALDTLCGIEELKAELGKEELNIGLNLTNGFVINQAFYDTKEIDWERVFLSPMKFDNNMDINPASTRNNLNLQEEVVEGISDLKMVFPEIINKLRPANPIKYVTTGYVVRMIVKGSLMKRRELI